MRLQKWFLEKMDIESKKVFLGEYEIVEETEKAIKIAGEIRTQTFKNIGEYVGNGTYETLTKKEVWIPKSVIMTEEEIAKAEEAAIENAKMTNAQIREVVIKTLKENKVKNVRVTTKNNKLVEMVKANNLVEQVIANCNNKVKLINGMYGQYFAAI